MSGSPFASLRNPLLALAGLAALVAFPLFNPPAFLIFLLVIIFTDAMVVLGFNLLVGYSKNYHIAPLFFIAVGAYSAGWLSSNAGLHPFLSILAGGAIAVVSSFIFSPLHARIKGFYMALFSIVLLFLTGTLVTQFEPAIVFWTGGPIGILEIPDIQVGGLSFRAFKGIPYYYFSLALMVATSAFLYKLLFRSKLGFAIQCLKQNDTLAMSLGVESIKVTVIVFVISSFLMGVSGAVVAHFIGAATPAQYFNFAELLHFYFQIVFGGIGTFTGPIIGAFIMDVYDEVMISYPPYYLMIKGLLVAVALVLLPRGIMGEVERRLWKRVDAAPTSYPVYLLSKIATGYGSNPKPKRADPRGAAEKLFASRGAN